MNATVYLSHNRLNIDRLVVLVYGTIVEVQLEVAHNDVCGTPALKQDISFPFENLNDFSLINM